MQDGPRMTDSAPQRLTQRAIFRLVLMLSLWHAPVPLLHAHDGAVPVETPAFSLNWHLQKFHSNVAAVEPIELGWHLHFVLISELCQSQAYTCSFDVPSIDIQCTQQTAIVLDHLAVDEQLMAESDALTYPHWVPERLSAAGTLDVSVPGLRRCRHFLPTFSESIRISNLLGIARC